MSTLAIPSQRVRLYRVLWDRWIIVLRILFDLGAGAHPVRWRAVADTLLVDKKTVQKYLSGLAREGHIVTAGDGYMLTQAGMDILLENNGGGEFLPLEGKNLGEKFSPLVVEVVDSESELKQLTTTTSKVGKNLGEKFSLLALQVIQHIPDIFNGSELTTNGLSPLMIDEILLGWVAYAYDKRTSLNAPVGLIHSKLKRDERPPMEYVKNYADFLPEVFLDGIGLWSKTCIVCEEQFSSKAVYDEHFQDCLAKGRAHVEDDDEELISLQPDKTVTKQIAQAWQSVLMQLAMDMPKASFETWVRDTVAVRFVNNTIQIATRNAYAQDWLESRLQSTVERLLVGIMNKQVKVEFIVAVETGGVS